MLMSSFLVSYSLLTIQGVNILDNYYIYMDTICYLSSAPERLHATLLLPPSNSPSFSFIDMTPYKAITLLAVASLSPAWAGAFNSSPSTSAITSIVSSRHCISPRCAPSTEQIISRSPSHLMKPAGENSFLNLSTILFLRGGQQDEDAAVASDDTLDADVDSLDINMQRRYGTQDEEAEGASVEMKAKSESLEMESDSSVGEAHSACSLRASAIVAPISAGLHAAAKFYTHQLAARPIFTKSMTAGIIFGLSDWCAQLIEKDDDGATEKKDIVFSRVLTAFLVGLLFFGPAANAWYTMIFKILPSTSLISTLQKAALGQIIFGPAFSCVFFGAGMIQSGTFSFGGWVEKIKQDLPGVWASGLGFWPLVDFISYKVIPVQWIPLFVNFCSFVWTIYLSLVANDSKSAKA
jgi:protein Mpv17